MPLELIATLTVGVAAIWVPISWVYALQQETPEVDRFQEGATKLYLSVRTKAALLFEKVSLLEGHASDYYNSLNDAGLTTLISMRNTFNILLQDLEKLNISGQYEDLHELCKFLLAPVSKSYPKIQKHTAAKLEILEDWEQRSNELLIACVIKLSVMSSKNESVGVKRAHKRKPTVHTIDELRQALNENRIEH